MAGPTHSTLIFVALPTNLYGDQRMAWNRTLLSHDKIKLQIAVKPCKHWRLRDPLFL
jgi:hypothetical protein